MLFCATRDNVRRLHASLVERGFSAVALSGEHSQNERNQALQALRDRRAKVCVATDVAARGIDLPRSEEHTSELQSLMRSSYAVFCLKKKTETANAMASVRTYKNKFTLNSLISKDISIFTY